MGVGKLIAVLSLCRFLSAAPELHWGRQSFLAPLPPGTSVAVAFFDLDGTLRISSEESEIIEEASQIRLLENVAARLKELADAGYLLAVVSNHAWVPQKVPHEKASRLIWDTLQMLRQRGALIHYYDYAGSDPAAAKPGTALSATLEGHLRSAGKTVDYSRSFMVGDDGYGRNTSDSGFAKALGIPFIRANRFFSWEGCDSRVLRARAAKH